MMGAAGPWALLVLGGLFEVGFTTCLRFVDGFRNIPWTIGFLASVGLSMTLLEVASRSIPMGTAYAVWGGIGAVGTVLVGILVFGEPAGLLRAALILGIVACIAGLKLL
jgi:quaternary ammonium compound-resistance protein SugE